MTTARKLRIRAVENASGARGRGVGNIRMHNNDDNIYDICNRGRYICIFNRFLGLVCKVEK